MLLRWLLCWLLCLGLMLLCYTEFVTLNLRDCSGVGISFVVGVVGLGGG